MHGPRRNIVSLSLEGTTNRKPPELTGPAQVIAREKKKRKPPPVPVETAVYKPGSLGGSRQPRLRHPDQPKPNHEQTRGQMKLASINHICRVNALVPYRTPQRFLGLNESKADANVALRHIQEVVGSCQGHRLVWSAKLAVWDQWRFAAPAHTDFSTFPDGGPALELSWSHPTLNKAMALGSVARP